MLCERTGQAKRESRNSTATSDNGCRATLWYKAASSSLGSSEEDVDDPDAPLGHENKAALVEQVMQIGPEEQDVSCVVGRVGTRSFGTGRIPKHLVGVEPVVLGVGDEVGGFGAEDGVHGHLYERTWEHVLTGIPHQCVYYLLVTPRPPL